MLSSVNYAVVNKWQRNFHPQHKGRAKALESRDSHFMRLSTRQLTRAQVRPLYIRPYTPTQYFCAASARARQTFISPRAHSPTLNALLAPFPLFSQPRAALSRVRALKKNFSSALLFFAGSHRRRAQKPRAVECGKKANLKRKRAAAKLSEVLFSRRQRRRRRRR